MENLEAQAKLRVAVKQGNETRVKEVLNLDDINPNMKFSTDTTSHTPLTQAIDIERPDIVELLIKHPKINPNLHGYDGFTPLTMAVNKGSLENVSHLLSLEETDVNLCEGGMVGGMTALHLAVLSNNLELVKLLVADPRIDYSIQFSGQTALMMAEGSETTNREIIDLLYTS